MDIVKCDNQDDLKLELNNLKNKNYSEILIQDFMNFDCEYVCSGSCGKSINYYVTQNIRSWPKVGGTGAYATSVDNSDVNNFAYSILSHLKKIGYTGLCDIEIFKCNSKFYLNEINLRVGGKCFVALANKNFYPVEWFFSVIEKNEKKFGNNTKKIYCMDETTDVRNFLFKNISFKVWIKDFINTNKLGYWDLKDPLPAIYKYLSILKKIRRGDV